MSQNQTLFDDLADVRGILKGIDQLSAANEKYGKTAEQINERIRASQKQVIEDLKIHKQTITELNVAQKARQTQLQQEAAEAAKVVKIAKEQNELLERNRALFDSNAASVSQLKTRVGDLRKEYDSLGNAEEKELQRKRAIEAETKALNRVINEQVTATKRATEVTRIAVGSYDALNKQVTEMKARLGAMPDAFNQMTGAINKNNKAAVDLQKQIEKSDQALKRMDASMGNHQRNVGHYGTALGSLKSQVLGLGAGFLSVQGLITGLKSGFDLIVRMERMDTALRAVTKDNEDFMQTQQFLISLSKDLGQDYEVVTKTYKGLAAATRETSLEGKAAQAIFSGIVKAGATLQLSNEEVEGSLYAISQMISKGKVSMEELRQQLGERLPGAMKLLANAMGIGEAKLNSLVESGKLYARDVLPKLATELDKVYGKDAQKNLETVGGQWNNLTTEVSLFLKMLNEDRGVTGPLTGLFKMLSDRLEKVRIILQSKDWGLIIKLATDLTGASQDVNNYVKRAKANEGDEQAYRRMSPEARAARRTEFVNRQSTIQGQINSLQGRSPRDVNEKAAIQERIRDLQKELEIYDRKILRMQVINQTALKEEAILKQRLDKEVKEQKQMEWEDGKKKRDAAAKRAENEADRKLRERLQTSRTDGSSEVNRLRGLNETGEMADADYINAAYKARTNAALEQISILNKANKQHSAEWKSEYAAAQKEITDAAADWGNERNKQEEEAWNKVLETTKKALQTVGDAEGQALKDRVNDLDVSYAQQERKILDNYNLQLITEKAKNDQIQALREGYINKLTSLISRAYSKQETVIESAYDAEIKKLEDLLRSSTLTTQQIADAKIKIEELRVEKQKKIDEAESKRKDKLADAEVKREENVVKKKRKLDQDSEEFKTAQDQLLWQAAGQAAEGYFNVINGFRERDLDSVEKKKDEELKKLERSKEYDLLTEDQKYAAKIAIEKKYDAQSAAIKRKQAIAEKANALFQIGIDLAVGIIRNNKNFTPLAAAPLNALLIALAAFQTAAVMARPIPAFKDGKGLCGFDRYEGPALVGEAGRELWFNDRGVEMVDKPSIKNVGRDDVILPNSLTEKLLSDQNAFAASNMLHRVGIAQVSSDQMTRNQARKSSPSPSINYDAMGASVAKHIMKLPFDKVEFDGNEFKRSVIDGATKRIIRNGIRRLGDRM